MTLVTWAEYLCDFLEMTKTEELTRNIATVRKGYYSLIDTDIKLKILQELVEEAITTSPVREKLSERVDQRQALAATKRESTRKAKDEQNSSIDGLQDDNESVDEQGKGKEEKDKNNISRSKTEGKRHGVSICSQSMYLHVMDLSLYLTHVLLLFTTIGSEPDYYAYSVLFVGTAPRNRD